jgi:hypothetical protein
VLVRSAVDGQTPGRGLYIRISDDARRLPMKAKAEQPMGALLVELTQVKG